MRIFGRPKFEALTAEELAARGIDGPRFVLLEEFRVWVDNVGMVLVAPGFETDWASVPPMCRAYLDDDDPRILVPSLIHDWLYAASGEVTLLAQKLTREECDDVLRRLMIHCGSSRARALTVYLAVRIGGASHWGTASK